MNESFKKNRKIKFRVWDRYEKKFLSTLDGLTFSYGHDSLNLEEVLTHWDYANKRQSFLVQEFIGLFDKNDKEIYEADLLKCKGYDGWFDNVGHHYNMPVEYKSLKMGETISSGFLSIPDDREIIGHINSE